MIPDPIADRRHRVFSSKTVDSCLVAVPKSTEIFLSNYIAMESVLKDLEGAEDEVCEIMKVAEETLQELQNLPQCDTDKLTALSSKYMELIKSVYLRLSAHSSTMTKTDERDDSNIYTSSKEREIYDSLMTLSDTTAHDDENF